MNKDKMVSTKYHNFEDSKKLEYGNKSKSSTQLMYMYQKVKELKNPLILELGTEKGVSTTIFLQVCEENNGQLISIDINNCSDISKSSRWEFIQSDSTDINFILSKAPHLRNGIDVLYIDTIHTKDHVEKELLGWYPFLNKNAHIFIDDVDSSPYRKSMAKDNIHVEISLDELREYVKAFFHSNKDSLFLNMLHGSTGLAHLYKFSPKGTIPQEVKPIIHRRRSIKSMAKRHLKKFYFLLNRK